MAQMKRDRELQKDDGEQRGSNREEHRPWKIRIKESHDGKQYNLRTLYWRRVSVLNASVSICECYTLEGELAWKSLLCNGGIDVVLLSISIKLHISLLKSHLFLLMFLFVACKVTLSILKSASLYK